MTEDLKSLKNKVRYILERFPLARQDDTFLTIKLWEEFYINSGCVKPFPINGTQGLYLMLKQVPSTDDIVRLRAHIQNKEGLYKLGEETTQARQELENNYRDGLGYSVNSFRQE